jgi:hypothetical protein
LASQIPQWIQDVNTVLGIVGFFITVIVMFQVRSIRQSFRAKARLPKIIEDLNKAGSALSKNLGNWPANKNDGGAQVKVAASLIASAIPLVPRASRRSLSITHDKLSNAVRDFSSAAYDDPSSAWDLYGDILSILAGLNQIEQNLIWE